MILRQVDSCQRHSRRLIIGLQLRLFDRRAEILRGKLPRDLKPLARHLQCGLRGGALLLISATRLVHGGVIGCLGGRDLGLGRLDAYRQGCRVQRHQNITAGNGASLDDGHLAGGAGNLCRHRHDRLRLGHAAGANRPAHRAVGHRDRGNPGLVVRR